jgi:hypothetical protein
MQRLAKAAIILALLAMILPTAVRELAKELASSRSHGSASGNFLDAIFTLLFWSLFSVGLLVRLARYADTRNGTAARMTQQQELRERAAVRRPAEDVPVDEEPGVPEDDDPELFEGE